MRKIDQNIRANQKISGGYFLAKMPILATVPTYGPLYTNDFGGTTTHYVRLAYDYTINPSLLNHLNFGYTRRLRLEDSPGSLGSWDSKLGWHGGLIDNVIPVMQMQYNYAGSYVPTPPANNGYFADNSYQFNETLSWSRGRHNWKFGAEHRRQEFNVRDDDSDNGSFNFTNVLTSAGNDSSGNPIDPNSGDGVASFFLGAASTGLIQSAQADGMRAYYYAIFAQDDWKVNRKLNLNLGLRYELSEPVKEAHSRLSQVNPTLPNPGADGLPGAIEFQGNGAGRDGKDSPQSMFRGAVGPRIGLAYQVDNQTVLRAAYGIYYEALKVSNFANTDSAGFFADNYNYQTQTNLQTPSVIPSQVSAYPGKLPPFIDPTVENGLSPVFIESKVAKPGTILNWTIDVQRQLPGQWILDTAYVGAHGYHLQAYLRDPNVAAESNMSRGACLSVLITQQSTNPACAGQTPVPIPYTNFLSDFGSGATVAQALRPFPQYGDAGLDTALDGSPFGDYTYEALQIQINKRLGSGLTVLANYTWSKNLTDADSDYPQQGGWSGNEGMMNPFNPRGEKSYAITDQPQVAKIAYTYELPIGKGKKFLGDSNKLVDTAIGGWTVSGVNQYAAGTPLWAYETGWTSGVFAGEATNLNVYAGFEARPNVVPGVSRSAYHGGGWVFGQSRRINAAAFTLAPSYTFGNAPRLLGDVRNFASKDEDLAASKNFHLGTDKLNLLFRFDAFNIFNRHSWNGFDEVITDPNFGESTGASGNRTMQASARVTF